MKKLVSVRLSDRDNNLLKLLSEKLQMSQAEVISRALERYAENRQMDKDRARRRSNCAVFYCPKA